MKPLDLKSFCAQSLGISSPWKVTDVIFDGEDRVVTEFVECASGMAWADPETGERAEIKDWQERTWHHLDTCQFQTIVTARVPRLLLKNGKSITPSLPWVQKFYRLQLAVCVKLCAWVELCLAGVQAGLIFSTQEPWAIWFLICRSAS